MDHTSQKKLMLDTIRNSIDNGLITVYRISKGTGLRQTTIWNIVKGKTQNPHETTLEVIFDYLDKTGLVDEGTKQKIIKDDEPVNFIAGDNNFEAVLVDLIKKVALEVVKGYTDKKFADINEHILYLMRGIADYKMQIEEKSDNLKTIK
jgi:hypothetical protein